MSGKYTPIATTFSKDPIFWGHDFAVQAIEEGNGTRVKGSNGKWYLDWVAGLGANLLGYGDGVDKGAYSNYMMYQARRGNGFSLPSVLEEEVAELLVHLLQQHVPGWANTPLQVRWVKTGSDACEVAIRLARAVTGKKYIASHGYHGWGSDFVSMTPPGHGIPAKVSKYMRAFDFNVIPEMDSCAGVILEQGLTEPDKNYYNTLRAECDQADALLIMDEVVTGFRYAPGGASEVYGVQPDLICLGKGIANGYPLAAVAGPTEYMQWFARNDPVFVSSTNFGDTMSLASAKYVLEHWNEQRVAHLYEIGNELLSGLKLAGWQVVGHAPRSLLLFADDYHKAYFIQEMAARGILMNRPNFPTWAHTMADVEETLAAAREVYANLQNLSQEELEAMFAAGLPTVLFRNR
jgi:glutamate-1-semialdehyde 2,1-aminomutase